MNKLRRADRNYAKVSNADIIDTVAEEKYLKQATENTVVTNIRWVDLEELPKMQNSQIYENDSQQKTMVYNDSDEEDPNVH